MNQSSVSIWSGATRQGWKGSYSLYFQTKKKKKQYSYIFICLEKNQRVTESRWTKQCCWPPKTNHDLFSIFLFFRQCNILSKLLIIPRIHIIDREFVKFWKFCQFLKFFRPKVIVRTIFSIIDFRFHPRRRSGITRKVFNPSLQNFTVDS